MSLRRPTESDIALTQASGENRLLDPEQGEDLTVGEEFAEVSESLARVLEKAGITRSALESTLPQARRRVFARHYPQLASELDRIMPV